MSEKELRDMVMDLVRKTGKPLILELKDGTEVREIRINPDGGVDRLWEDENRPD